jgi:3-oxoacyl-[acyl-carrier-protein] synthase II
VRGPITLITNACASGANAIGHAFSLIRLGLARRVLCGGYDALCQHVFAGFDSLQALSPDLPRPFDSRRDGLALGEGAGVIILERLEEAQARGATILAEVTGYGAITDLHHLTQPRPDGGAAEASMTRACAMACRRPSEVGYINAHGTGTPLNDAAEAKAIASWAGPATSGLAVSSTKGSIGHLLGGAGAVEAVICLMVLKEGWLPPNANLREVDPAVGFDLVLEPRQQKVDCVLTNSFGFGGANASLVLERVA